MLAPCYANSFRYHVPLCIHFADISQRIQELESKQAHERSRPPTVPEASEGHPSRVDAAGAGDALEARRLRRALEVERERSSALQADCERLEGRLQRSDRDREERQHATRSL